MAHDALMTARGEGLADVRQSPKHAGWTAVHRVALAAAGTGCLLVMLAAAPALADTCPNAALRTGVSASLPDCRAYEQVSPTDTNGYDIEFGMQAVAGTGDSITYISRGSFAGDPAASELGDQYLSVREPSGWSTEGITPAIAPSSDAPPTYAGFSSDLSQMVLSNGDPPLDGATPGTDNLYLRESDGSLELVTIGEPSDQSSLGYSPQFDGASSDYAQILFEDQAALTPNAPNDGNRKLYEWDDGSLSLVSVLPDGTPSDGVAGSGGLFDSTYNAISADGSRVYWSNSGTGGGGTPIFLSDDGASTEITTAQCTTNSNCITPASSGTGTYWTASSDGSLAYFTSGDELTNDATPGLGIGYGNLYQYDADTGQLTDLTVDSTDADGADVQGVVGASSDGSYVYYVADGALASGATAGQPNLYLWHAGTTTFIATFSSSDSNDWNLIYFPEQQSWYAQVSADGQHLLFTSAASLSPDYDNAGQDEVYLYDAGSGALTCVSCNPSGAAATAGADLANADQNGSLSTSLPPSINMSSDGTQVFFESADALLPQDSNGLEDVYEWEADGSGSCQSTAQNGGCLYSISTGSSPDNDYFEDASPSGDDVFFLSRQPLVAEDSGETDANVALYDARVDGGFPASQVVSCEPEDCHGSPAPAPPAVVAASVTFYGPGDATSGSRSVSVKVLRRVVRASRLALRVRVPARGRVTVSGAGVRTARHAFGGAGVHRLRIALTARAKRTLSYRKRLRLRLRVRYVPAAGVASTASVSVEVRR